VQLHVLHFMSICLLCGILSLGYSSVVWGAPAVEAISPNNGQAAGGTSVTITGKGFISGSTVKFGMSSATGVVIESSTKIKASSPAGSGLVGISVTNSGGTSAATPYDQFGYDPAPNRIWLGLDGNSSEIGSEHVGEFASHDVIYDRGGGEEGIDIAAGSVLEGRGVQTKEGKAIAHSIEAGMIPDILLEYEGYEGNVNSDPHFPATTEKIETYVKGFIKTASAILSKYPGRHVDFEPMNEPWNNTTPHYNGAEYANVIAKLLPEVKGAGIPLNTIYIAAFGEDCVLKEGKEECTSNGWIPAMYAADPKLREEIGGWYFHPYGEPSGVEGGDNGGIEAVPVAQAKMTSGQNNIIVSEVGYCSQELNEEKECPKEGILLTKTNAEAAKLLTEMLDNAKKYYEAGWLRELTVYDRRNNGWAMQKEWKLVPQGEALDKFSTSFASWATESTPDPSDAESQSHLEGVSCVSPAACIAVGWYENTSDVFEPLTESWNGLEWAIQTTPSTGGTANHLEGVSCSSATACTAVGWYTKSGATKALIERWNGQEWAIQTSATPTGARETFMYGVSCSSSTVCSAVGYYDNSSGTDVTLAEQWEGGEWKVKASQNPEAAAESRLHAVSCVSSTSCTAVGWYDNSAGKYFTLGEAWNGTEWVLKTTKNPAEAKESYLYGVSCTTSSACTGTGVYESSTNVYKALAERWNGSEWSEQTASAPAGATEGGFYGGTSCWSSTACVASGDYKNKEGEVVGLVEEWNGTEWKAIAVPVLASARASYVTGVSCNSSAACVGSGWDENTSFKYVTLAETDF
jgi:IPT/TIG domain